MSSNNIPKGKKKYENCFVVFLDILGFKDKVFKTKKDDKLLETLIKSLRINQYFTQSNKKEVRNNTEKRKIEIRSYFFSDSFVFIMKENAKNLAHLFLIIRYLQDRFWENDLCFRGAITKGKMYWPENSKENIILGPAMIEAYKLESQIAIYPRILISKDIVEYVEKNNISAYPISNRKKLKEFIKKDKDGIYFFDILHPEVIRKKGEDIKQGNDDFSMYWDDSMENNYKNILKQVEEIVEKGIKNQDEKIKQKYEWLKSYLEEIKKTTKIPEGWKKVKLGEVLKFGNGKVRPKTKGNIPIFGGNGILGYCDKFNYEGETIIIGRVGAYCGSVYFENKPIWISDNALSAKPKRKNDTKFLYYFLKNLNLNQFALGSSHPLITQTLLNSIDVEICTDKNEQKAIASVLSSLDDKIDLLYRQNKTLEQMAETLFRQWFIEEAKEEWEEVSLGNSNLAKIIKSGIDKFEGEKIYLATGDVNDTEIIGGNKIKYNKRPSRANMQPLKFSVWFAKKGGVRKLLMFDDYSDIDNIILSTGFTGLKTTELSHYYIWCFVLLNEFQEIKDSFVSGTVQPDINNEGVLQILIPKPDEESLKEFNEIVRPLFTKIQANNNQIRTLKQLRDTLLPKLMSGEVRVDYEDN